MTFGSVLLLPHVPAGSKLDATHSRNVIMIQFGVGAAVSVFMVLWRWWKLQESKVRLKAAVLCCGVLCG
jgi:hypothetical protein